MTDVVQRLRQFVKDFGMTANPALVIMAMDAADEIERLRIGGPIPPEKGVRHDAILGCEPRYELVGTLEMRGLGWYSGTHDEWNWSRSAVLKLSEDDAHALYTYLKE